MSNEHIHIDEQGDRFIRHPLYLNIWVRDNGSEVYSSKILDKPGEPWIDLEEPARKLHPRTDDQGYWRICFLVDGKRKYYRFSRLLWECYHQEEIPEGYQIDHKNHNLDDNTQQNLRLCTHSQNQQNRKKPRNTSHSPAKSVYCFHGVRARKNGKNYQAQIRHNGENVYLGCFKTALEAETAYDEASKKYHGEFGLSNAALRDLK